MAGYMLAYMGSDNKCHRIPVSSKEEKRKREEERVIETLRDYCCEDAAFADRLEAMLIGFRAAQEMELTKADKNRERKEKPHEE